MWGEYFKEQEMGSVDVDTWFLGPSSLHRRLEAGVVVGESDRGSFVGQRDAYCTSAHTCVSSLVLI